MKAGPNLYVRLTIPILKYSSPHNDPAQSYIVLAPIFD